MTPIQKLIKWAKTPQTEDNQPISIMTKMKQLLEVEKQALMDAFDEGMSEQQQAGNGLECNLCSETYYNETFNKK